MSGQVAAAQQAADDTASVGCPTLLIAAPASGQGKTTLTAALARWHVRQGRRVRIFKCGPDFLDPAWLELASGATVHNVDPWMTGMHDIRARLYDAAREADVILIEGVMGLFDGEPSAADLALALDLPVLALVDASRMAGTFAALAFGATVRFFSPLSGEPLPDCDAIWLPGGYPELHAHTLSQRDELRRALHRGVLRGHTFHYSTVATEAAVVASTRRPADPASAASGEPVFRHASMHASFFHAWFASHPRAVAALFGAEPVDWDGEGA